MQDSLFHSVISLYYFVILLMNLCRSHVVLENKHLIL